MRGPDEGVEPPLASRREVPGEGSESRAQTLPTAEIPTKDHTSSVIIKTNLFALGIGDSQGVFYGLWINVRSVDLFPEHGGEILDLEFRPINEGFTCTA